MSGTTPPSFRRSVCLLGIQHSDTKVTKDAKAAKKTIILDVFVGRIEGGGVDNFKFSDCSLKSDTHRVS